MAGRSNHNTQDQKVKALDRHVQALELRKAGASYRQIAVQLGYAGPGSVHRAVENALTAALTEAAEPLRAMEAERLDKMQMGVWAQATAGNFGAIDRVLRIMERRAKLFGLDAPVQQDIRAIVEHEVLVEIGEPRGDDYAPSAP